MGVSTINRVLWVKGRGAAYRSKRIFLSTVHTVTLL